MFASCLQDLIDDSESVVIECDPRLEDLFRQSFPKAVVYGFVSLESRAERMKAHHLECQVAYGSLPARYRRSLEQFPERAGYLTATSERVQYWRERLSSAGHGLKIGISWRGGLGRTRRIYRSIPLSQWRPILEQDNTYVSLQYDVKDNELDAFERQTGTRIHHWESAIRDYAETAALVCALDMVISVCTSVIHLAGSLGQTTWVMTPHVPEWRYGYRSATMPWYPSVRLYRQEASGGWSSVVDRVAQTLEQTRKNISGTGKA